MKRYLQMTVLIIVAIVIFLAIKSPKSEVIIKTDVKSSHIEVHKSNTNKISHSKDTHGSDKELDMEIVFSKNQNPPVFHNSERIRTKPLSIKGLEARKRLEKTGLYFLDQDTIPEDISSALNLMKKFISYVNSYDKNSVINILGPSASKKNIETDKKALIFDYVPWVLNEKYVRVVYPWGNDQGRPFIPKRGIISNENDRDYTFTAYSHTDSNTLQNVYFFNVNLRENIDGIRELYIVAHHRLLFPIKYTYTQTHVLQESQIKINHDATITTEPNGNIKDAKTGEYIWK